MAGASLELKPLPPDFENDDDVCGILINNRYEIKKKLGSGSFGLAYLAVEKDTNKKVALKKVQLAPNHFVKNEAVLLSSLNHANIVRLIESFFIEGLFWIVLEYCENGDLGTKIQKVKSENGRITPNKIIRWTYQMLDALQYMHSRKVLHRDLKPANILLVGDNVKLADFGVSKQLLLSTCHSAPAGTWAYMSPEMFTENYNSKSDIWSLGCVFYELFTLELICGPGAAKLMPHVLKLGNKEELPNLNEQRYNEIFKKMVDYDVKRRPSAAQLLEDRVFAKYGGTGVLPDELKVWVEVGKASEQRVGVLVTWVRDDVAQVTSDLASLGIPSNFNLQAVTTSGILESRVLSNELMYCNVYACKIGAQPDKEQILQLVKNSLEQAEQETYSRIAFLVPEFGNHKDLLCWFQDAFRSFKPKFHLEEVVVVVEEHQQEALEFCQKIFKTESTMINYLEVRVLRGDITSMRSEGFVNSCGSNYQLDTNPLTCSIREDGGEILETEIATEGSVISNTLRVTSGGNMSAVKTVFHVSLQQVGDIEKKIFAILQQCVSRKIRSLAIPAIGTGNLGYNPKAVAKSIRKALERFTEAQEQPCSLKKVDVVVFQPKMLTDFQNEIIRV